MLSVYQRCINIQARVPRRDCPGKELRGARHGGPRMPPA
jgi:hypothetical protein